MEKTIYLINVLGKISDSSSVFSFCLGLFLIVSTAITIALKLEGEEELYTTFTKVTKDISICFVICFSLSIFIPSRDAMYHMLIADKVLTKETYNKTFDETKKLIDYTINRLDEVKGKK